MIDSCGNAHCHVLIMFAHNFDRNLVAENKRVYYAGFIRVTGPVRILRYDAGRYGTGLALRVTRVLTHPSNGELSHWTECTLVYTICFKIALF